MRRPFGKENCIESALARGMYFGLSLAIFFMLGKYFIESVDFINSWSDTKVKTEKVEVVDKVKVIQGKNAYTLLKNSLKYDKESRCHTGAILEAGFVGNYMNGLYAENALPLTDITLCGSYTIINTGRLK